MGRKQNAFAEDGAAKRLPTKSELKKFIDKLDKLHEVKDQNVADIKGVYDDAANANIDREALKEFYKRHMKNKDLAEETKRFVNFICKTMDFKEIFIEDDAKLSEEEENEAA